MCVKSEATGRDTSISNLFWMFYYLFHWIRLDRLENINLNLLQQLSWTCLSFSLMAVGMNDLRSFLHIGSKILLLKDLLKASTVQGGWEELSHDDIMSRMQVRSWVLSMNIRISLWFIALLIQHWEHLWLLMLSFSFWMLKLPDYFQVCVNISGIINDLDPTLCQVIYLADRLKIDPIDQSCLKIWIWVFRFWWNMMRDVLVSVVAQTAWMSCAHV